MYHTYAPQYVILILATLLTTATVFAQGPQAANPELKNTPPPATPATPARVFSPIKASSLEKNERILFIGDDGTQQMFYTRAVATALLALYPNKDLRFFNGGRKHATVKDALSWIDDLVQLTRPTAVFIFLGQNDAGVDQTPESIGKDFEIGLVRLVNKIKSHPSPHRITLISTVPTIGDLGSASEARQEVAAAAKRVSAAQNLGYCDVFGYLAPLIAAQTDVSTASLSLNGQLLTESGQLIVASVILRDMGVLGKELDRIGFAPLHAMKMGEARVAMALKTKVPPYEKARHSRALYESMRGFDEAFFRQWRLAGTHRSAPTREEAGRKATAAWNNVRRATQVYKAASRTR